jgi:hypothetical protein
LRTINRLPPEIISHIARHTLGEDDVDARPIVPLTHVCQYWRDSIVSTPDNWSLIFSNRRKLAELSLERAKAVPLTIRLDLGRLKEEPGFFDLLLAHVEDTVSFSCMGFHSIKELTQALPNFPKSMPNLRSLVLGHEAILGVDRRKPIDPFDFSTHIALKELSLSHIPLFSSILNLRTLTTLSLCDPYFDLPIDTLLSFLEENRSLESVSLTIKFAEPSLRRSRRPSPLENTLQRLSVSGVGAVDIRALVSSIALRKGATLETHYNGHQHAGLTAIFSEVSTAHLPSLTSPIFMEYQSSETRRGVRLLGPDGSFSYDDGVIGEGFLTDIALLKFASIRELRLGCRGPGTLTKFRLRYFHSLEVLAIDGNRVPLSLTSMFPDPVYPPLLKTLAFLDCCYIPEDFLAKLAQIALDRQQDNPSTFGLDRVVIMDSEGHWPPSAASIELLRKYVPVVEVLVGSEFPKDLSLAMW